MTGPIHPPPLKNDEILDEAIFPFSTALSVTMETLGLRTRFFTGPSAPKRTQD